MSAWGCDDCARRAGLMPGDAGGSASGDVLCGLGEHRIRGTVRHYPDARRSLLARGDSRSESRPPRAAAVIGGRQAGKAAVMGDLIERALDAGQTVAVIKPGGEVEVRGAATARDITPAQGSLF